MSAKTLWGVRLTGSPEIYAAKSLDEAEKRADAFNANLRIIPMLCFVGTGASAEVWPGDSDSHVASLAAGDMQRRALDEMAHQSPCTSSLY